MSEQLARRVAEKVAQKVAGMLDATELAEVRIPPAELACCYDFAERADGTWNVPATFASLAVLAN